jgi:hypothetical protein
VYYLVIVYHKGRAVHLTRSALKGFQKCCISNAVDDMLWKWNVRSEEDEDTDYEFGDSDT